MMVWRRAASLLLLIWVVVQAQDTTTTSTEVPAAAALPVVHKCCKEDEQFSLSTGVCEPRADPWRPPVFAHAPLSLTDPVPVSGDNYTVEIGLLSECQTTVLNMDAAYPDALFLLDDGRLYVQSFRMVYSPAAYCMETLVAEDGTARLGAAVCDYPAEEDAVSVEDRPTIQRCCVRRKAYDPTVGCLFNETLTGPEVPPPVDLSNATLRAALTGSIDNHYRFAIDFPNCDNLTILMMGDKPFFIDADGTLVLRNSNVTVAAGEFCVNERATGYADDAGDATSAVALVCADAAEPATQPSTDEAAAAAASAAADKDSDPYLHKCCAPGYEVLIADDAEGVKQMTCVSTSQQLDLHATEAVPEALRTARMRYGQPPCAAGLFEVTDGNFSMLEDGRFRLLEYDEYACNFTSVYVANASTYCMDTKRGSAAAAHAFYCYKMVEEDDSSTAYVFFPILMGITDFFLLVTFIVYLTVPDPTQTGLNKKRKLSHSVLGMILLAYISSLFFAYLVLMIVQTATEALSVHRTICKVLAVTLYFFLLSAFFWLSVICFEIYLSTRADKRTSGKKRFKGYGVYAWGCPFLMAMLALIMDLAPGIDNCSVIKPAFGRYRCLFQNRKAFIAYFYIPIGVLLGICLTLYILTVRNLSVPSKMPGKGDSSTMSQQSAKQQSKRRRLCAKLFLIMGITWVAELLSYLIGDSPVWYFFDVINILQGFFIFVAFILRPKVLQYIKKTALQSLSRSFGHDSQQDGGGVHQRAPGAHETGYSQRPGGGQPTASPMTMSTRTTGTSTRSATGASTRAGNGATNPAVEV